MSGGTHRTRQHEMSNAAAGGLFDDAAYRFSPGYTAVEPYAHEKSTATHAATATVRGVTRGSALAPSSDHVRRAAGQRVRGGDSRKKEANRTSASLPPAAASLHGVVKDGAAVERTAPHSPAPPSTPPPPAAVAGRGAAAALTYSSPSTRAMRASPSAASSGGGAASVKSGTTSRASMPTGAGQAWLALPWRVGDDDRVRNAIATKKLLAASQRSRPQVLPLCVGSSSSPPPISHSHHNGNGGLASAGAAARAAAVGDAPLAITNCPTASVEGVVEDEEEEKGGSNAVPAVPLGTVVRPAHHELPPPSLGLAVGVTHIVKDSDRFALTAQAQSALVTKERRDNAMLFTWWERRQAVRQHHHTVDAIESAMKKALLEQLSADLTHAETQWAEAPDAGGNVTVNSTTARSPIGDGSGTSAGMSTAAGGTTTRRGRFVPLSSLETTFNATRRALHQHAITLLTLYEQRGAVSDPGDTTLLSDEEEEAEDAEGAGLSSREARSAQVSREARQLRRTEEEVAEEVAQNTALACVSLPPERVVGPVMSAETAVAVTLLWKALEQARSFVPGMGFAVHLYTRFILPHVYEGFALYNDVLPTVAGVSEQVAQLTGLPLRAQLYRWSHQAAHQSQEEGRYMELVMKQWALRTWRSSVVSRRQRTALATTTGALLTRMQRRLLLHAVLDAWRMEAQASARRQYFQRMERAYQQFVASAEVASQVECFSIAAEGRGDAGGADARAPAVRAPVLKFCRGRVVAAKLAETARHVKRAAAAAAGAPTAPPAGTVQVASPASESSPLLTASKGVHDGTSRSNPSAEPHPQPHSSLALPVSLPPLPGRNEHLVGSDDDSAQAEHEEEEEEEGEGRLLSIVDVLPGGLPTVSLSAEAVSSSTATATSHVTRVTPLVGEDHGTTALPPPLPPPAPDRASTTPVPADLLLSSTTASSSAHADAYMQGMGTFEAMLTKLREMEDVCCHLRSEVAIQSNMIQRLEQEKRAMQDHQRQLEADLLKTVEEKLHYCNVVQQKQFVVQEKERTIAQLQSRLRAHRHRPWQRALMRVMGELCGASTQRTEDEDDRRIESGYRSTAADAAPASGGGQRGDGALMVVAGAGAGSRLPRINSKAPMSAMMMKRNQSYAGSSACGDSTKARNASSTRADSEAISPLTSPKAPTARNGKSVNTRDAEEERLFGRLAPIVLSSTDSLPDALIILQDWANACLDDLQSLDDLKGGSLSLRVSSFTSEMSNGVLLSRLLFYLALPRYLQRTVGGSQSDEDEEDDGVGGRRAGVRDAYYDQQENATASAVERRGVDVLDGGGGLRAPDAVGALPLERYPRYRRQLLEGRHVQLDAPFPVYADCFGDLLSMEPPARMVLLLQFAGELLARFEAASSDAQQVRLEEVREVVRSGLGLQYPAPASRVGLHEVIDPFALAMGERAAVVTLIALLYTRFSHPFNHKCQQAAQVEKAAMLYLLSGGRLPPSMANVSAAAPVSSSSLPSDAANNAGDPGSASANEMKESVGSVFVPTTMPAVLLRDDILSRLDKDDKSPWQLFKERCLPVFGTAAHPFLLRGNFWPSDAFEAPDLAVMLGQLGAALQRSLQLHRWHVTMSCLVPVATYTGLSRGVFTGPQSSPAALRLALLREGGLDIPLHTTVLQCMLRRRVRAAAASEEWVSPLSQSELDQVKGAEGNERSATKLSTSILSDPSGEVGGVFSGVLSQLVSSAEAAALAREKRQLLDALKVSLEDLLALFLRRATLSAELALPVLDLGMWRLLCADLRVLSLDPDREDTAPLDIELVSRIFYDAVIALHESRRVAAAATCTTVTASEVPTAAPGPQSNPLSDEEEATGVGDVGEAADVEKAPKGTVSGVVNASFNSWRMAGDEAGYGAVPAGGVYGSPQLPEPISSLSMDMPFSAFLTAIVLVADALYPPVSQASISEAKNGKKAEGEGSAVDATTDECSSSPLTAGTPPSATPLKSLPSRTPPRWLGEAVTRFVMEYAVLLVPVTSTSAAGDAKSRAAPGSAGGGGGGKENAPGAAGGAATGALPFTETPAAVIKRITSGVATQEIILTHTPALQAVFSAYSTVVYGAPGIERDNLLQLLRDALLTSTEISQYLIFELFQCCCVLRHAEEEEAIAKRRELDGKTRDSKSSSRRAARAVFIVDPRAPGASATSSQGTKKAVPVLVFSGFVDLLCVLCHFKQPNPLIPFEQRLDVFLRRGFLRPLSHRVENLSSLLSHARSMQRVAQQQQTVPRRGSVKAGTADRRS